MKYRISAALLILGCTAAIIAAGGVPMFSARAAQPPNEQPAAPLGSAFTYQGRLKDAGSPTNGPHDLQFRLYDAAVGGNQVGGIQTVLSQTVIDGLFTVLLDFGASAFQGDARWLEIAVRPAGGGAYTTLSPRQALAAAPYAASLMPGAVISGTIGGPVLRVNNSGSYGLYGTSVSGTGVYGSGSTGVRGESSGSGNGVSGSSTSGTGVSGSGGSNGVYGSSPNGHGVLGSSSNWIGVEGSGGTWGVYGSGSFNGSVGVYGTGTGSSSIGVQGVISSTNAAVYGDNNGSGFGVRGESSTGYGVYASTSGDTSDAGVYGTGGSNSVGVYGVSSANAGVDGASNSYAGVRGIGSGANSYGVLGIANNGTGARGVYGSSTNGTAVYGFSTGGTGVAGNSSGHAVSGTGTSGGVGIYGTSSGGGFAGYFFGPVHVQGTLSKSAGAFKIDHPLDPANKYLYHSFVESPDMMNIYNGNVTTDAKGEAIVILPEWFEAVNRDFRYQLTAIGQFAQAIVSREIESNRFTIKTDKPNVKVSWQVTGIRHDPYAEQHRIPVEKDKPDGERGKYLNPTEHGQPESKGIDYERSQQIEQKAPGDK